jgi:hypothetical protein
MFFVFLALLIIVVVALFKAAPDLIVAWLVRSSIKTATRRQVEELSDSDVEFHLTQLHKGYITFFVDMKSKILHQQWGPKWSLGLDEITEFELLEEGGAYSIGVRTNEYEAVPRRLIHFQNRMDAERWIRILEDVKAGTLTLVDWHRLPEDIKDTTNSSRERTGRPMLPASAEAA